MHSIYESKQFVPLFTILLVFCLSAFVPTVQAQDKTQLDPPPLPLHGIEGMGGIFSTYSAHLTNPARKGNVLGLPSLGLGYVDLGHDRNLVTLTVTETLWDRVELGFAWNRFDLGDLPDEIMRAHSINIDDDYVDMFNVNIRVAVAREGDWDVRFLPAITVGAHYKYNDTIEDIDEDLNGHLKAIGIEENEDVEFTVYASKMFTNLP